MAAGGAAALHVGVGGLADVAVERRLAVGAGVSAVAMGPAVFFGCWACRGTVAASSATIAAMVIVATVIVVMVLIEACDGHDGCAVQLVL